jgi:outer membrane protein assembly factor BamB
VIFRACAAALLGVLCAGNVLAAARTVVLIGGEHREGPGKHDYPAGIRELAGLLQKSVDDTLEVVAYPDGWPADERELARASTIVWYFDGLDRHPLRDAVRRVRFEELMQRGVGLVALHQASTVPAGDDLGLSRWLGGARHGMFDRTTEWAELEPSASHPVTRGLAAFDYRDEFYPTFRFAEAGGTRTPLLTADLHPQFRDGRMLVDDPVERVDAAWAFERDGGGRAVVYSGTHFDAAFGQPAVRKFLRNAVLWTAGIDVPERAQIAGISTEKSTDSASLHARDEAPAGAEDLPTPAALPARATFHIDPARSGWRADETVLSPANVAAGKFGQTWQSPRLDDFDGHPPRLYASPLYVERVRMAAGPHRGETFATVFAASSNGFVYAINASRNGDIAPGRILWRKSLGAPCLLQPAPLDGVPTGILSTPVIDIAAGRMYVTHCSPEKRWQAYALDIASGEVVAGWPVTLDEETFNRLNRNAGPQRVPPKRRFDFRVQRGALNLSPDGSQLYVVFGESETGWLAAVDTGKPHVTSAFAAVAMPHRGSGGIWGAGGPAVDSGGHVYVVTGSGFDGYQESAGDWAQSLLKLSLDVDGFTLRGSYTPFNWCRTSKMDIDLGSGGAMLMPGGARNWLAIGGKQGNVYLLDRDRLPGRLDRRAACSSDASTDSSLLPPLPQPQFGARGPLNVFGPYSEEDAALDLARARSLPAAFRDDNGSGFLFVTGNTKAAPGSAQSVPPSVAKLKVVEGDTPHLAMHRINDTLVLDNPGSPVVTSRDAHDALVWILDENAPRSALLTGKHAPQPVLYALDGETLDVRWRSAPGELYASGKYNEPAFGGGQVFVGTDRIQAFGVGGGVIEAKRDIAAAVKPAIANDTKALDAAAIYEARCAMCHDHPQGNIPPRSVLATRPHARIVAALTGGAMQVHASGLTAKQIDDLARYLQ